MIEGLWWKPTPNTSGFVALSNTSSQPVEAKVAVSNFANAKIGEQEVHLSPHGTK
jgi:hypothetical protein